MDFSSRALCNALLGHYRLFDHSQLVENFSLLDYNPLTPHRKNHLNMYAVLKNDTSASDLEK